MNRKACVPCCHVNLRCILSVPQVQSWALQQGERIQATLSTVEAEREEVQRLLDWICSAEESLNLRDQDPLPEDMEQMEELITQHAVLTDITNQTHYLLNSRKLHNVLTNIPDNNYLTTYR